MNKLQPKRALNKRVFYNNDLFVLPNSFNFPQDRITILDVLVKV